VSDRSIAVLPFENLSPDPNDAFFAAGITDDILSAIARIPEMEVISRRSMTQYEGTTKPIRQIAEELGVGNVMEGSVRRVGNRIRIVVQLIDAGRDRHIWTETYDRELTDVFAIQSEIAQKVATALDATLSAEISVQIEAGGTEDPEAYGLFLQGRERLHHVLEDFEHVNDEIRASMALFHRAVERDPQYAAAWAWLGIAYCNLALTEDPAWADSAAAMAQKALDIDPMSSQAQIALSGVHSHKGRKAEGLTAARRAVELDPNNPDALEALTYMLWEVGRLDEALPTARKLVRVEPNRTSHSHLVIRIYRALEMYDEAEAWSRNAIALSPEDGASHAMLSSSKFLRGDLEGAKRELDTAQALSPTDVRVLKNLSYQGVRRGDFEAARDAGELLRANLSKDLMDTALLGYVYDCLGDRARARSLYAEGKRNAELSIERGTRILFPYVELARLAILDSDRDKALHMLEGAYERGMGFILNSVRMDPILAKLEGDPEYARFVARIEADVARMRKRVRAAESKARK
jgi:TolB-like protein/Flp pilus assembly protein TadD